MKPTIGRRMYFFCTPEFRASHFLTYIDPELPFDAGVIYANEEGTHVNVVVTDHSGMTMVKRQVPVVTEPEDHGHSHWVEWMPYQKEQAAKVESLDTECKESLMQRAAAWLEVHDTLNEVYPGWQNLGSSGTAAAVTAIRNLKNSV